MFQRFQRFQHCQCGSPEIPPWVSNQDPGGRALCDPVEAVLSQKLDCLGGTSLMDPWGSSKKIVPFGRALTPALELPLTVDSSSSSSSWWSTCEESGERSPVDEHPIERFEGRVVAVSKRCAVAGEVYIPATL